MASVLCRSLVFFIFYCAVFVYPTPVWALYSFARNELNISLGGFVGLGGWAAKYPGSYLDRETGQSGWSGDFRLLADAGYGENLVAKINILQNVRTTPDFLITAEGISRRDVERSSCFYWQQHESPNTEAALVLDAAYIKYGSWTNELTVGRQPVTTTVTFFFSPNDFFAPFSPNTFFRVYKPGVDAIRYERKLKALSQLSVIGVLGYEPDIQAESGWSDSPELERSSFMARATHAIGLFEIGALGGIVRESMVTGFSMQGELFNWLGLRTEGHYADSWNDNYKSGFMGTISFEHRYPSSLTVRLEYMYNGYGEDSIEEFIADPRQSVAGQNYLGKHYTALDLSYEITPLLFGEMLILRNWSDDSYTVSLNSVFSVSDESDLTVTLTLPGGSEPEDGVIQSELGSLPVQFSLEYRLYF